MCDAVFVDLCTSTEHCITSYNRIILSSFVTHTIPRHLWKRKVHYRVHKSPPFVPVLNQINSSTHPKFSPKIHLNIIILFESVSQKRNICYVLNICIPPPHACYLSIQASRRNHPSVMGLRIMYFSQFSF